MIKDLNGFFNAKKINKIKKYDDKEKVVILSNENQNMIIDFKHNKISITDKSFFHFINDSTGTNYSRGIKLSETKIENPNEIKPNLVFDLKAYNINIYNQQNKSLIPLSIFNILFCSPNYYSLYYNGVEVFGTHLLLQEKTDESNLFLTATNEKQKETIIDRKNNLNNFLFILDHFYGLKRHFGISTFKEYIKDIQKDLLSVDPNKYNYAYSELVYKKLDELHTSLTMLSINTDQEKIIHDYAKRYIGKQRLEHKKVSDLLNEKRNILKKNLNTDGYLIKGNTAYIILSAFLAGTNEDIEKNNYLNDSFSFLKRNLEEISKNKNVKNIIIDISRNPGGNVGSMLKVLGLLTNKDIIQRSQDTQNKFKVTTKYKIDANNNGDFNDNDAFDQFNYYILTSKNTFSAANLFAGIAKEMNIAKIIGQKSGGGGSPIFPVVLNDQTSMLVSGPLVFLNKINNIEQNLENGVEVDIKIDYKDFYDIDYLLKNIIKK
ncbi:S41 family peptidase [Metamycoplasma canadense]|uniref:Tail specific protease domain-containing protein n=1 Tax=Metamycoplasma canadense TaxID=29554 RepID=A0A077L967_9BACT|nr:S41 family peptidase [Metamycoplasma canadense]BAP39563.1 hypothetical protein MCAN360_0394 [Metamycoplasma canadense]